MLSKSGSSVHKPALLSILCVYSIWGIQPLYWQFFKEIPLSHVLAHRILWSALFLLPITIFTNRWNQLLEVFKSVKHVALTVLCALAIGSNWMINIYAASTKQVIEASLGHYITPIVVIFLGVYIFKESIQLHKLIAAVIASSGVLLLTVSIGKLPMIALLLIITFTLYTFLKKITPIDPIVGITVETLLLLPFMVLFLYHKTQAGQPLFVTNTSKHIGLLISTGVFTSLPLLLFSYGVRKIDLSNLGFIQYYAPSISLVIGIFVFKEKFTVIHLISFGLIWLAILVVMVTPFIKKFKNPIPAYEQES